MFHDFEDKRGRVWEWFIDDCYFHMTCVRVKGERRFNSLLTFHFPTSDKASEFVNLIKESK
jgi:hypothetical protein